eukprot:4025930-Pleurochrysis_carterae.AAC.1
MGRARERGHVVRGRPDLAAPVKLSRLSPTQCDFEIMLCRLSDTPTKFPNMRRSCTAADIPSSCEKLRAS